ncbi:glycoside hydrolase family 78 protein [Stipitochalara longipes BDJ]|nr:glycoside hydrolase family 78 protein [Stipitochalara longipes BDJ]
MVKVTRVRFEHHEENAIGIGENKPRISWSFEGSEEERDWTQGAYELEVRREDGVGNVVVEGKENILVPWEGKDLGSGERAEVRVRVKGVEQEWTDWSDKAIVEVGILDRGGWKCALIEPGGADESGQSHRPVVFRHKVEVEKGFKEARLYITTHGVYEAEMNGRRVGDHVLAPGWTSYGHRLVYQTFDVSEHLVVGANSIQVSVAEGWYCGKLGWHGGRKNLYGDSVGLIAMLVLQDEGGKETICGTDDAWKWAYGPVISAGLYDGEIYDFNAQLSESSTWNEVKSKPISNNLVAPDGPPVRRTREILPKEILKSPSGKTIVDLGQNMVGWIKVSVDGPKGTAIKFQFVEVLENGEAATRPLRDCKARDTLILSGDGRVEWEPRFTFHGFRYVEVENWPGKMEVKDITGIVVHTDMRETGYFSCSSPLLNKLHENVRWSMRGNFLSIPTDCPQRDERLGWTGDINAFADTANYLYDTSGMLSSWLRDLSLEQSVANGIVPLVVPNVIEGFDKEAHAIWGDVAVMLPWSIFLATGDVSLLSRQYGSMKSWLEAIPRRENGLWNYTSEWKLGDWLDPAAPADSPGDATTDPTLVADAFLVHITTIMAEVSIKLNNAAETASYTSQAYNLRKEFAHEYITASGLLAADTQTAFALAISFSLFPTTSQEARAGARLSHIVRANSRFKIATGFAGTRFIGDALTKVGESNLFYRMLMERKNPSWLYPVTMGATTIWERWDSMLPDGRVNPGEMTSFNHYALGAVAGWMHGVILGLGIVEPGWKVFRITPVPGAKLKWAEGKYLSGYGECAVRWEIRDAEGEGKLFWMRVKVPPNTTAQVNLPGSDEVEIVGSGTYTWEVPYEAEAWPPRAIYPPIIPRDDDLPDEES